MTWQVLEGDAATRLADLDAGSVQTCITSPPYWGLRDYGTAEWQGGDADCDHAPRQGSRSGRPASGLTGGKATVDAGTIQRGDCHCGATRIDSQLGLEPTPEAYVANLVAVFREVRRVLRDDGTLWVNLGSSYFGGESYPLREIDAAWLAAVIDGEGCVQVHRQRKSDSADSFQLDLSVGMMTPELVQRAYALTGLGSCHQQNRGVWDWSVRGQQTGRLLRALYPYLLTKKKQAAAAIMLCDDLAEKRFGRGNPATVESLDYRQKIKQAVSDLNQRRGTDFPIREPRPLALSLKPKDDTQIPHLVAKALQEDGWYLRSDVIWAKPNPMPESVTDRPTKAHEYLFLLTKSPRYFYDADAIREAHETQHADIDWREKDYAPRGMPGELNGDGGYKKGAPRQAVGNHASGRNKRSVWTVSTQPFPGAHFATFPPKLIEPCVLAGTPPKCCGKCGAPRERITKREGSAPYRTGKSAAKADAGLVTAFSGYEDGSSAPIFTTTGWRSTCDHDDDTGRAVVLDPFAGAGTTGLVALRHDRDFVGIELNPEYAAMARNRIRDDAPLFNVSAEA